MVADDGLNDPREAPSSGPRRGISGALHLGDKGCSRADFEISHFDESTPVVIATRQVEEQLLDTGKAPLRQSLCAAWPHPRKDRQGRSQHPDGPLLVAVRRQQRNGPPNPGDTLLPIAGLALLARWALRAKIEQRGDIADRASQRRRGGLLEESPTGRRDRSLEIQDTLEVTEFIGLGECQGLDDRIEAGSQGSRRHREL
jgi:hypothetical protein